MSILSTRSPQPPLQRGMREMTATELDRADLLRAEESVQISRFALFIPTDELGSARPIVVRRGAVISAFAVVHGGATIAECARVETHAEIGKPEHGYAVGRTYPGAGATTILGPGVVIRSGAAVYADVQVDTGTVVGHQTLLRTGVRVGADTSLGHHLCVERETWIGRGVRCSPGSHITSSTYLADRVFLGAGVRTINDKTLTWRDLHREPTLTAPRFETGAKSVPDR